MSLYDRAMTLHSPRQMLCGEEGKAIIKHFEDVRLTAYYDAVGVLTIGWGSIRDVHPGMVITMEEALKRLEQDIRDHEAYVRDMVHVPLNQWQYDALVSWTFNLGGGSLESSTMLKRLNDDEIDEVPYQMMRWAHAGGKWLRGLAKRRHAEALMFAGVHWKEHKDFRGFNKRRYKTWCANHKYDLGLPHLFWDGDV